MTIATEWNDRVNDQLSVNDRVRRLALRSLSLLERGADFADRHYQNGMHPENFIEYFRVSLMALNPENIDTLSKVIDRTIHTDYKVGSQQYHDINKIAKELNRLGYRIVPQKQVEEEKKKEKKGYSPETINLLKSALYGNVVKK